MNKLRHLVLALIVALCATSCQPDEVSYQAADLVGRWVSGSEYYRYDADGTGATWDTADDVSEDEAQPFTWSLATNRLTLIHQLEMGGVVPKTYYIEHLDDATLTYSDSYGNQHSFTRYTAKQ